MRSIFFVIAISILEAGAQDPNPRIDSLFMEWNRPMVPGVAVGVVQNGEWHYQKGFGMANLKNGTLIDSSTEFWIASVTKQFTAFGIYLLEADGKVSLEKSIRHYIPELPFLFEPITIDQLIHHTSGLRDGFVLTALSKKMEDEYTNANVLKYLKQQKELNFSPGAAFEYNNSGYVLLALVIEKVSRKSYTEYMKTAVFTPLGMMHTNVSGKHPATEKTAEGYHSKDYSNNAGSFEEGHFKGDTYGSTGIVTTLHDIGKWESFIQHPHKTKKVNAAKTQLVKAGNLISGSKIAYAGGLETFVYDGEIVLEHFGADEGFKANILFFPSHTLSIIGLSNNTNNYGLSGKLYAIADIMLGKSQTKHKEATSEKDALWEQSYFNTLPFPAYRNVKFFGEFAKVSETPGGSETTYYYKNGSFQTSEPISMASLQITKEEINILDNYYHQNKSLKAINHITKTSDFSSFTGKYYSDELAESYEIILSEQQLYFEFVPGVRLKLERLTNDTFIFDYFGANYIAFAPNQFALSREGIHKLKFTKM